MLERSAEKGFLPAMKELVESYTKISLKKLGYSPSERVAFYEEKAVIYQGVQNILTNTTLGAAEQGDLLRKAFEIKSASQK